MILPSSHLSVFILLILGMLGWGLWANTFKTAGGKWRFELFYFDFALGVLLAAVVLALTAGSLGFDGFSFIDDLRLAGKRQDVLGLGAGVVFNLGNMLLLAAISLAGMSIAFPIGMGLALIVAAAWNFALNAGGNTSFILVGMAVMLGAIVVAVMTSKSSSVVNPPPSPDGTKKKAKKKSSGKAVILSLAAGVLLGSFWRLIQMGMAGENGLGPYSIGVMFSVGVLFSTFVFNLFFMNLPVAGEPIEIAQYFRARVSKHGLGVLGGILWYAGLITTLIVERAPQTAAVSTRISYTFEQAAIVVAALSGVFLWREFDGAKADARVRMGLTIVLLVAGIGLSAIGIPPAAVTP
jgi:glucose uptake protein